MPFKIGVLNVLGVFIVLLLSKLNNLRIDMV